jgi:hypothetical protein
MGFNSGFKGLMKVAARKKPKSQPPKTMTVKEE